MIFGSFCHFKGMKKWLSRVTPDSHFLCLRSLERIFLLQIEAIEIHHF